MSLVDSGYGSDEDEDDLVENEENQSAARRPTEATIAPSPSFGRQSEGETRRQSASTTAPGLSTQIRLPDISELLGPSVADDTSTSHSQRKRPAVNGSGHSMPHPKLPRGALQPSRIPPDTAGGLLTPPQLRGRSNVATEDLDKIFTRRQKR